VGLIILLRLYGRGAYVHIRQREAKTLDELRAKLPHAVRKLIEIEIAADD
jgi:hypothetical protein